MSDLCGIADCEDPTVGRGWCNKHYRRWLNYGDPLFVKQLKGDPVARFNRNVEKIDGGCWLWHGVKGELDYGRFYVKGRNLQAHRWSYEHHIGPIPDGLHLDHLCRVHSCVNPEHLEPVTCQVNVVRGWEARGRPTHCKRGHPLEGANLYVTLAGKHRCKTCHRDRVREYHRVRVGFYAK